MADADSVTIPDKPAFKAGEVCELAQIQPYVLRSWESEFPELGLSKTPGGPRIYRRTDVERVLRIRDLVFTEGLTLSGVRRRFESEQPAPQEDLSAFVAEVQAAQARAAQAHAAGAPAPPAEVPAAPAWAGSDAPALRSGGGGRGKPAAPLLDTAAGMPDEARSALVQLKQEMRSLLDLLGGKGAPPATTSAKRSGRG